MQAPPRRTDSLAPVETGSTLSPQHPVLVMDSARRTREQEETITRWLWMVIIAALLFPFSWFGAQYVFSPQSRDLKQAQEFMQQVQKMFPPSR